MRNFGTWSNMMLRQAEGWEAKITADMKQQLADLGYRQDEVRHLTPLQAVEIITAGRPPAPRPISAAAASSSSAPTVATTSSFPFPSSSSSSSSTPASASASSPEVALDASGRTRESADTVLLYSLAVAAPPRVAADRPSPSSTSPSASTATAPPPPITSKSTPTPTAITAIALTGLPPSST